MHFWLDPWLEEKPLLPKNEVLVLNDDREVLVSDLWRSDRGWDWAKIGDILSYSSLLKLAEITLSDSGDSRDSMGWLKIGGAFTVSSAYELFTNNSNDDNWPGWRLI